MGYGACELAKSESFQPDRCIEAAHRGNHERTRIDVGKERECGNGTVDYSIFALPLRGTMSVVDVAVVSNVGRYSHGRAGTNDVFCC